MKLISLGAIILSLAMTAQAAQKGKGPVKVFLLVGQSNMVGHGKLSTLTAACDNAKADPLFKKLRVKGGAWVKRDDVWIWYNGRTGDLSVGYGAGTDKVGPELQFGQVMGDFFGNQVLLVKCAWGGKSVFVDFRPPSSGGQTGEYYTKTVEGIKTALADLKKNFPRYDGKGYEIVGLAWFQGWNDMCDKKAVPVYEENLSNLIKDLRKEFKVPNLPVVIGETGNCGNKTFRQNQAAVASRPEFKGTVAFVPTEIYKREGDTGPGYHWNNNAESYCLIGNALGAAMKELVQKNSGKYIPGIDETTLSRNTAAIHKKLVGRSFSSALTAMEKLKKKHETAIAKSGATDAIKKEQAELAAFEKYVGTSIEAAVEKITSLHEMGDLYRVDLLLKENRRSLGGLEGYSTGIAPIVESLKEKKSEISLGRSFHSALKKHAARPGKSTVRAFQKLAEKNPDSPYGKAARAACEILKEDPATPLDADSLFQ